MSLVHFYRYSVRSLWAIGTAFSIALLLTACQPKEEKDEGVPAGITGINHTRTYIAEFYVDGTWGGNISSIQNGGGGGSTVCCVALPSQYSDGLTAKVRWNHTEDVDNWKEAVATVFPYPDGAGRAWVHFMPDDSVQIVVSNFGPGHPQYPGPAIEDLQEEPHRASTGNRK